MDELTLDDKKYISSKRAAQITGYAKDYVGQLCREARVEARQIGRNWYILESSIREHRFGKEEPKTVKGNLGDKIPTSSLQVENEVSSAWQAPSYTSQTASILPTFPEKRPSINVFDQESTASSTASSTSAPISVPTRTPIFYDEVIPVHSEPIQTTQATSTVPASSAPVSSELIAEMQSAWQDWFQTKQYDLPAPAPEALIESPDILEQRSNSYVQGPTIASTPLIPTNQISTPVTLDKVSEVIQERSNSLSFDGVERSIPIHKRSEAELRHSAQTQPTSSSSRSYFDMPSSQRIQANDRAYANTGEVTRPTTSFIGTRDGTHLALSPKKGSSRSPVMKMPKGKIIHERKVTDKKSSVVLQSLFLAVAVVAVAIALLGSGHFDQYISQINSRYNAIQYLGGESTLNK